MRSAIIVFSDKYIDLAIFIGHIFIILIQSVIKMEYMKYPVVDIS